jgi:hypothetical protein
MTKKKRLFNIDTRYGVHKIGYYHKKDKNILKLEIDLKIIVK